MPNFLTGTPSRFEKIKRFAPGQEAGIGQVLQQALAGLQGQQPGFAPIAERATKQFHERTIPSIAERFTGMGAQRSSGFQEALGGAGSDLATNLAALESQFNLGQQGNLLQMLGIGLTPTEETGYFGEDPGLLKGMAPGVGGGVGGMLKALPEMLGTYLGGAAGGAAGGPLGATGGAVAGEAAGKGASKFIQMLMRLFSQAQQGSGAGGVSMTPSQNPILGSNII